MGTLNSVVEGKGERVWIWMYVGVFVFTVLSGYTTMLGVSMVIPFETALAQNVVSFLFAFAAGLMMIGISFLLKFEKTPWRKTAVSVYFILLCISVFFNFNALYGVMEKRIGLGDEAMELRTELVNFRGVVELAVSQKYGLKDIQKQVDDLAAKMSLERKHYARPGEGPRYHQLKQQHDEVVSMKLEYAQASVDAFNKSIDKMVQPAIDALEKAMKEENNAGYQEAIQGGVKTYVDLKAEVRKELPGFTHEFSFVHSAESADRPERALLALRDYWVGNKDQSGLSSQQKSDAEDRDLRIVIALAMSVVIDMPLFLFMVILSLPDSGAGLIVRIRELLKRRKALQRRRQRQGGKHQKALSGVSDERCPHSGGRDCSPLYCRSVLAEE